MMDPLLPNLVMISLKQCRNCQNLPALGQLPSLKDVYLEELDALQFIEGGSVVRRQREWFPSLKRILLFANPNLESWVKEEEEEVSLHSVVLLFVRNCPKLSTMPILPSLEVLKIEKCSEKLMLSLLKVNPEKNAPTSSLPNSSSLANLKHLDISSCDDLLSLSEDGLQNLASLETLNIKFCPRMASLPEQGLGGLTSLVSLKISDCESLASLSGMRYLTALQKLHLARCEKMHILEDDMDGLTSLRTLEIEEIPNLVSIPKGLQNATALKEFSIINCESLLHAFPEGISLPTTLEKLWIVAYVTQLQGGPNSGMRCKKLHISEDNMDGLTSLLTLMIESIPILASITAGLQFVTALKKFVIKNCQEVEPLKDLEKYDLSIFLPCDFPRVTRKTATIGFLRWKQNRMILAMWETWVVKRFKVIDYCDLNDQYHSSETAAFGEPFAGLPCIKASEPKNFDLNQDVTVGSSSLQRSQTSHLDLNEVNHVGGTSDSWHLPSSGWFKLNFIGSSKEVCMGSRRVAGFGGTISNSDGPVIKPYAGSAGEVPSVDSEVLALWNGLKLLSHPSFQPSVDCRAF
ncbi:hypothetical protein IFM89_032419 [Coptis chinensis]|uniref:R13L1/DRL21-like LRR repeat region domain-containing protein n=1 Tax=Coptis chinensis TaxID=261450 RepID=A0A835I6R3_9MAGN|nr:hypothetical protein IFM89_032419 [Coptis chinensis]